VLIGAVLEPGRLSPKLVSRAMLRAMRAGSVFIDVGIDHGGIGETSRMTSISAPTFVAEGVLHYGVANMPALVARTATLALAQAALPCVHRLAEQDVAAALRIDAGLRAGMQVWDGAIVHPGLAVDVGLPLARWQ
jgi:alanine dehydrogenase